MNYARFTRSYRPSIRLGKHGHPMRDPEGHAGGFDSPQGGDNGGSNSGEGGNGGSTPNNGGQSFDPMAFWNSPDEGGESGNGGENGTKSTTPSGGQQNNGGNGGENTPPANPAQQFVQQIQSIDFGKSVMTDQVVKDLGDGNYDSFHENINAMGRNIMAQTFQMMLPLMQQIRDSAVQMAEQKFTGTLGNRDNNSLLSKEISAYNNPASRPVIDSIFNRAMTMTKGNKEQAIQFTKDMLKFQATELGKEFGIAPPSSEDNFGRPAKIDWMDELAGRQ